MDIGEIVAEIRDHYVGQFLEFTAKHQSECERGAAEVQLMFEHRTGPFHRYYCADFLNNDDGGRIIEMMPGSFLRFGPIGGHIGEVSVVFESMCWDDVQFVHDAESLTETALLNWFGEWFDIDERRIPQPDGLSGRIHSLSVHQGAINVDFGTAEPEAFWQILDLLIESGARQVVIGTTRDAAD